MNRKILVLCLYFLAFPVWGSAGDLSVLWNPQGRNFYELISQKTTAGAVVSNIVLDIKKERKNRIDQLIKAHQDGVLDRLSLSEAQKKQLTQLIQHQAHPSDEDWDNLSYELAHLSTLKSVFDSPKILEVYNELLAEQYERSFKENHGDGLKWLVLFRKFIQLLEEGEELPARTLKKKELKIEFQKFINSVDPALTAFIPEDFRKQLFISLTDAQEDAAQLKIDKKYARPYIKRALVCSGLLLSLGIGTYVLVPSAHKIARLAFDPFGNTALRGKEHANSDDGQKAADAILDTQVEEALPLLK